MEILSTLVAFYSIVIIVYGLCGSVIDISDDQDESPKILSHTKTTPNIFILILTNPQITRSMIGLKNPRNFKPKTLNKQDEDNDLIDDHLNRASKNNDKNLNLRDERKSNHPFRISFDFTAKGIPNLSEVIKFVPLLRLDPIPKNPQFDSDEQDYACTLSTVNCITKCVKTYPKEHPKNVNETSRQWLCILHCGTICGEPYISPEEVEEKNQIDSKVQVNDTS